MSNTTIEKGIAMSSPPHYIAETTVIKVPMVRPNAGLLRVIHLNGGTGEVFTMKEVTHHVIEYIKNRELYDPTDVAVVHCANDPLGAAFKVQRFTRNDALGLIWKNVTPMQDSCFHIHRQIVTPESSHRSRPPPDTPNRSRPQTETSNSSRPQTETPNRTPTETNSFLVSTSVCDNKESQKNENQLSSSFNGSSESSAASSSSSYHHLAAKASVIVSHQDMEDWPSDSRISSSEEGPSNKPKRPRTSVSFDEPDQSGGTWACQVTLETDGDNNTNSQNETVVVEYDSDTFSVEYELESSPDNNTMEGQLEGSAESDVSSSTGAEAALVIVCETDVEYLADYSDSNNESDTELTEEDKWFCQYCKVKNPPHQRNCGGCWGVRPDWLPQHSSSCGTEDSCAASQERTTTDGPSCSQSSSAQQRNSQKDKRDISSESDKNDDIEVDGQKGEKKESSKDLCVICYTRRKTASLVHGKTGHQVCCYLCARKLKKQRKSCPVCRKPIQKVIRNYNI